MPYDEKSFLSGLAVGRNMESWPALEGSEGGVFAITVLADETYGYNVRISLNASWAEPNTILCVWGDGTYNTYDYSPLWSISHTYQASGRYAIRIFGLGKSPYEVSLSTNTIDSILLSIDAPLPIEWPSRTSMFQQFYNLESLHPDTFELYRHPKEKFVLDADGLLRAFSECRKLKTIPGSIFDNVLFDGNLSEYGLNRFFYECSSLETVESGIFSNQIFSSARSCNECFSGCSALKTIPSDLFSQVKEVIAFGNTFRGCYQLEEIPSNLFYRNTSAQAFGNCFAFCTSIKDIPRSLFSRCSEAVSFYACFQYCSSLQSIPEDLFSGNPLVNDFEQCFEGCRSITSAVPELWIRYPDANGKNCFAGCTNAQNWADIPRSWGGPHAEY